MNQLSSNQAKADETPLAIARRIAPKIIARASEFEAARRIPADFSQELAEAGLYRLLLPIEVGGFELHPKDYVPVIEELSRADGSLGWCVMIGTTTALLAGFLPDGGMREIYGTDPNVITGGAAAPTGVAMPIKGGFPVTGRWRWASGSHNCSWLVAATLPQRTDGPAPQVGEQPEVRSVFFPIANVEIVDVWDTAGLRGTGSNDFQVKDLFVPEKRTLVIGPTARVIDRPLYRMPFFGMLAVGICIVALGVARRAVDELIELAMRKTPTWERQLLKDSSRVQAAVAEAEAAVRSARAYLMETLEAAFDYVTRDARAPFEIHRDIRLAAINVAWQSRKAVDIAYDQGGGSSIFASHPLQRCLRDAHTITQHVQVKPAMWSAIGQFFLGTTKMPGTF